MNTVRQCQHIQLISCMSQMEAEKALFIASGVAVIAEAYNLILEGKKRRSWWRTELYRKRTAGIFILDFARRYEDNKFMILFLH